jgi:hypothetical protein
MNLPQRIVLVLAFLVILVMALFPPWVYVLNASEAHIHAERPAGYHLLFGQHVPTDQSQLLTLFGIPPTEYEWAPLSFFSLRIDGTRLFIQLAATILLTSILYLALRRKLSGLKQVGKQS